MTHFDFVKWLNGEGWRLVEGYPESRMYGKMLQDLGKRIKEDFQ